MKTIEEIIIVEGRDDTAAVRRAVDAVTIETHGYGIRPSTWDVIDKAYESKGIIIFTDPDTAGEQIRRRLADRYPEAKHAFLDRSLAEKDGDIGIENASPDSIRAALAKVRYKADCGLREAAAPASADTASAPAAEPFTIADLDAYGLSGGPGAAERRAALGKALGIGYGNAKTFLSRLNTYGITREEWNEHGQAVFALRRTENQ